MGNKSSSRKSASSPRTHEAEAKVAIHKTITATLTNIKDKLGEQSLTIVVLGASGHLARTKTFPALFELFKKDIFTEKTTILGYARSDLKDEEFKTRISEKFNKNEKCADFLKLCAYQRGSYDKASDFGILDVRIGENEEEGKGNRLFYYALPPNVFGSVSKMLKENTMAKGGWSRMVIEKPFGRDSESAAELQASIGAYLGEKEVYRIDHYLAKELIQNVIALRFSNPIMSHVWNRENISAVKISFKEDAGVDGRGGYYDKSGCIRDVIQNHLLQVLSLVAMEQPKSLSAEHIRDAKVNVLKKIKPPKLEDVVLGQYIKNDTKPGFLEDETVPNDSNTETFCQMVLWINNDRWKGVPFICKAGKALDERRAEIRLQFKQAKGSLYPNATGNELVMRIQPDEAVWLRVNAKTPGLSNINNLIGTELDLTYQQRFALAESLPGAYTRLILDVLRGDHSLFVRKDELTEAWSIVTPLLKDIEGGKIKPAPYVRGGRGPDAADEMTNKYWGEHDKTYSWPITNRAESEVKNADP